MSVSHDLTAIDSPDVVEALEKRGRMIVFTGTDARINIKRQDERCARKRPYQIVGHPQAVPHTPAVGWVQGFRGESPKRPVAPEVPAQPHRGGRRREAK